MVKLLRHNKHPSGEETNKQSSGKRETQHRDQFPYPPPCGVPLEGGKETRHGATLRKVTS